MDRHKHPAVEHARHGGERSHLDEPGFVYRGGSIYSDAWSTHRGRGGLEMDRNERYEKDILPEEFAEGSAPGEINRSAARAEEEQRPYRGPHYGKAPKGYVRSDEHIRDDVNERLYLDDELDASEIEVRVEAGVVTLHGSVPNLFMKRRAEWTVDWVMGLRDVRNQLRIEKE